MRVCGIIAEYDPFHNGHKYHIEQAKTTADCIVVVMSGHAMQRGEIARFSKWDRARAALSCGADVVFELPTVYSCASAERFAAGAISIFRQLGQVDTISFGSECGDVKALVALAKQCAVVDASPKMHTLLKQGYCYPRARQLAADDTKCILDFPNNTLGVEYIKAAIRQHANFTFHTVSRRGALHHSAVTAPMDTDTGKEAIANSFASATHIRQNSNQMQHWIPHETLPFYGSTASMQRLEPALLYQLRSIKKEGFAALPDVTEGLENRLYQAARTACSTEAFLFAVKTKRYTLSRLRRILLHAALQSSKEHFVLPAPYVRILGFTSNGANYLSRIKKEAGLCLSPDFKWLYDRFPTLCALDQRATDLFALACDPVLPSGKDFTQKPVMVAK